MPDEVIIPLTQKTRGLLAAAERTSQTKAGAWREGNRVVMLRNAALPRACVKCGKPTSDLLRKTYCWSPSNLFRFIPFPGSLIALVIDIIRREKVVIEVPLCIAHRRKRIVGLLLTFAFGGAGLVAIGFGLNSALSSIGADADNAPTVIAAGIGLLLIGAACFVFAGRLLSPKKIEDDQVTLSGAGARFLQLLPTSPNLKP